MALTWCQNDATMMPWNSTGSSRHPCAARRRRPGGRRGGPRAGGPPRRTARRRDPTRAPGRPGGRGRGDHGRARARLGGAAAPRPRAAVRRDASARSSTEDVPTATTTRRSAAPRRPRASDGGDAARINVRMPEHLKARVDRAAEREGLSVNAWLVRAAAARLERSEGQRGRETTSPDTGPSTTRAGPADTDTRRNHDDHLRHPRSDRRRSSRSAWATSASRRAIAPTRPSRSARPTRRTRPTSRPPSRPASSTRTAT